MEPGRKKKKKIAPRLWRAGTITATNNHIYMPASILRQGKGKSNGKI